MYDHMKLGRIAASGGPLRLFIATAAASLAALAVASPPPCPSFADASKYGVEVGRKARVRSRVGELEVPVEISDEVRPGVVSLPHGFGHGVPGARMRVAAEKQPGVNSNRLTDETGLDALSGNAILNGIPVEVEPAPA